MVNETLVKFIVEHTTQGYNIKEIKEYLLKYGFKSGQIDEAIDYYYQKQNYPRPSPQQSAQPQRSQFAPPQLVRYVQNNLSKGYSVDQIRTYLLQYGYDSGMVEQAIQESQPSTSNVRHIVELHPSTVLHILLILLVVAGLGTGAFFLIKNIGTIGTSAPELLDYSIQIDNADIKAGESLFFINKITNMGDKRRYDISIEFRIINKDTLEELTSWSRTFAIDVVVDKPESVIIPKDTIAGKYMIVGTVHYGDVSNKASSSFKVLSASKEPSCFDGLKNQDETGIDCGGKCSECETCNDKLQNQNEEGVDCGGVCTQCQTCFDDLKNQDETGVDCGGVCSIPCKESESDDDQGSASGGTSPSIGSNQGTSDASGSSSSSSSNTVDTLIAAKEMALKNPDKAAQLCNQLNVASMKDTCLQDVAKKSKRPDICAQITDGKKRDPCYMYFVTNNNDYSLCDKISNDIFKDSCQNLKQLSTLQTTYSQNSQSSGQSGSESGISTSEPETGQGEGQTGLLLQEEPEQEPVFEQEPSPYQTPAPQTPSPQPAPAQPSVPSAQVIISNIDVVKVDYTTVKITWTTNIPDKSIVKYGNVPQVLSFSAYDLVLVTQHEVLISGLKPNNTYYFQVVSMDNQGNVKASEILSFKTSA